MSDKAGEALIEIIFTALVSQYPELSAGERRTVLGLSTDAGYTAYYVMLDERCASGPEAQVIPIPAGCCDISDHCLPRAWSFDAERVECEGRTKLRLGPHAWVAHWGDWMERLAVGDEATVAEAWEHARCGRVSDEP